MIDPDRLAKRAAGRREAQALVALFQETARQITDPETLAGFWDELQYASRRDETRTPVPASDAMTDEEAREYEQNVMLFGAYCGEPIREVPLRYLDWLLGEREMFDRDLRRYLRNEGIAGKLRLEPEDDP